MSGLWGGGFDVNNNDCKEPIYWSRSSQKKVKRKLE